MDPALGACSVEPWVLWADNVNRLCCLGVRLGVWIVSVQIRHLASFHLARHQKLQEKQPTKPNQLGIACLLLLRLQLFAQVYYSLQTIGRMACALLAFIICADSHKADIPLR